MHIDIVSSGAQEQHNEDWAGSFETPDRTDLVILDGGSSVADRDYIDPVGGDVAWFVKRFSAALGASIDAGLDQEAAVHRAVELAHHEFHARTHGQEIPLHAWPIAALSWLRAERHEAGHRMHGYCLGDCKLLLRTPDGAVLDLDPFVNPQEAILRAEIAKLRADGLQDPAARRERLLPLLRTRRAFQNTVADTNVLCLRPNGRFGARVFSVDAASGSAVLMLTDGLFRLVDVYGLHTAASLFALCAERGLDAALDQLRRHEAGTRALVSGSVKTADDASGILWHPKAAVCRA